MFCSFSYSLISLTPLPYWSFHPFLAKCDHGLLYFSILYASSLWLLNAGGDSLTCAQMRTNSLQPSAPLGPQNFPVGLCVSAWLFLILQSSYFIPSLNHFLPPLLSFSEMTLLPTSRRKLNIM